MLKIRALNRDSLSDEDAPTIRKEAQEEIALDLYNNALRLRCNGKLEESEAVFQQLLEENIPQLETQGGLPKTMSTLKYSCYTNLGSSAKERGDIKVALDYYLTASELDHTDVTLWYKIGVLALKLDRFRQAIYAFSQGLKCNESHWPCLDQLIVLLYAIRDTVGCLVYITKALVLDSDYTRGLVLRKQIYESNSATRQYYKLYNPDYILEPSLNVPIDEDVEKKCMEDVQKLCDRINEVEKSLVSKPLPCIPLPTPLEDFTWLSLSRTVVDLHKYISDNKMSHFCKVDLAKCMSQNGTEKLLVPEIITELIENHSSNKDIEQIPELKQPQQPETSEMQVETEQNFERRMSMNSENNGDVNDSAAENLNSSQAEDNDEMDQDTEDQEESTEQKTDKKRGTKRRRDLLLDLQVWGWHSKRKSAKKGRSERDLTIQDALKRIIPSHLLPNGVQTEKYYNQNEDSMNSVDFFKMFLEKQRNVTCLSPIHSPNPESSGREEYIGSQHEKDDVLRFWTKRWECCDAVSLIEELVHSLASMWQYKWPSKLVPVYIEAYSMYREHFEHPALWGTSATFKEKRNDALATLLFGELCLYQMNANDVKFDEIVHPTSLTFLQLISTWEEEWKEDHTLFFIRVHWLCAHIYRKSSENSLAVRSLQLVQQTITAEEEKIKTKFKLNFPNCGKYALVTLEIVNKVLKHLEMIDSLSRLEQLYYDHHYMEVAEILQATFLCIGNPPAYGKMGRPAQLGMLMDSLWRIDKTECFIWTEKCLHEAVGHFIKPTKDQDKWEMVLNNCLNILHEIIKEETVIIMDCLSEEQRCKLIESLCRIVCHQLNNENALSLPLGSVTPWIVMHYALLREEHREQAKRVVSHVRKKRNSNSFSENGSLSNRDKEVPPSIAVLFSAHEFLGRKGWCLVSQGELLHFIIDKILDRLDTPIFEHLREKLDIHLEQAFFCLYQHPSKKNKVSRHLADHNVNPLPLIWERAQQLYEFFCPDRLPEFDSYKSISISADLEQLLQRIIVLVPTECNPQPFTQKVLDFVNGKVEELPTPLNFPNKIRAVYYLLGDYYFKQNEISRSVKYFFLDICINPLRLDTWADLALGYASQLESKLNHCERFKNENEFLDKAKSARICFQQSLNIQPDHVTLWIEFGAFEYMVHSFCSRLLKFESDTFSMEKFEILENQKESYLDCAGVSFTKALDLHKPEQTEADERWLHNYMLGKVAEKRRKEPIDYLQYYLTAACLLNENNAEYPEKINYHNPQHLSVEALEIHYRIHASILKFLELHEGKAILSSVGKMFTTCLDTCEMYEVAAKFVEPTPNKTEQQKPPNQEIENKDDSSEIAKCVDDLITQVELKEQNEGEVNNQKNVVLSDADDKNSVKAGNTENLQKLKVKNIQEAMDFIGQTVPNKEQILMDIDSDGTNIGADDKSDRDVKSENINEKESKLSPSGSADNKTPVAKVEDDKEDKSIDETSTASSSSSDSSSSDSDSDDSTSSSCSTSSDLSTTNLSDVSTTNLSDLEVLNFVDRCIVGLEQCIIRFPQNYKALYRLVHLYFHYKARKDFSKCKQLLLSEYKCKNGNVVNGLFSDHKANNFFNGVWRIPSSEIDRPGSLAAHMNRCVTILLQVLRHNNDHKMLLDVCLQLKRIPDADKVYIKHSDREQLSEQALSLCIQSLKTQIKNVNNTSAIQKLVLDLFRSYQRVQKYIPQKESVFSGMLGDAYKKFMNDKIPENVNVLDLAIKFCQQYKAAEKLKQQQQKQNITPTPPAAQIISGTPMVLPTPSTAAPLTTTNQPPKRPSLGRPRGRPPGPKQPGLCRAPRGRSPLHSSGSFPWTNMMYDQNAMNYMMKYQEDVLRQYNAFTQMSAMNLGQFPPRPATTSASTSSSGSLLNPSQLVQMFAQMMSSGMNPLAMSQFTQSLSHLNPNLLKKLAEQCSNVSSGTAAVTNSQPMTSNWNYDDIIKQTTPNMKSTANKASIRPPKSTYTTAGFSKNLPLSTSSSFKPKPPMETAKSISSSFKPKPPMEGAKSISSSFKPKSPMEAVKSISSSFKPKSPMEAVKSISSSFKPKPPMEAAKSISSSFKPKPLMEAAKSNTEEKKLPPKLLPSTTQSQDDYRKAASMLNDRPSITITPVTQTIPLPISTSLITPTTSQQPPPPVPLGKTLQEKLADKQKQHGNINKMSFDGKTSNDSNKQGKTQQQLKSTFSSSQPSSKPHVVNLPSFPLDSGISISQLPIKMSQSSEAPHREVGFGNNPKSFSTTKKIPSVDISNTSFNLPPNMPLSVSVIKKTQKEVAEKIDSSDDDVIIIE